MAELKTKFEVAGPNRIAMHHPDFALIYFYVGKDEAEPIVRMFETQPGLLAACEKFADQVHWKPPWDDVGWLECYQIACRAIALAKPDWKGPGQDKEPAEPEAKPEAEAS